MWVEIFHTGRLAIYYFATKEIPDLFPLIETQNYHCDTWWTIHQPAAFENSNS
jgi:hypothetical protein